MRIVFAVMLFLSMNGLAADGNEQSVKQGGKISRMKAEQQLKKLGLTYGQQAVGMPEKLQGLKSVSSQYLLFIPESYGTVKDGSPLIMFLHGAGERGTDINLVKVHGIPKIVQTKKDFPFVAVSPQCVKDKWWNAAELKDLLDYITSSLDIDKSRIYLTGLSMGGFGTWDMSARYPDTFAAILPICGGGDPSNAGKIKDLPVWVFHGAKDNTVSIDKSKVMVDALKAEGNDVKFTIYPEAGHDSWTATYNNQDIYDWFLKFRRK